MTLTAFPNGVSSFGVPVMPGVSGLVAMNKVYFVDGVSGSDGNSGLSIDQPFATIQKAVNTVVHRDAILVLPHVAAAADYDETVTTPLNNATSGNAANNVTLMGVSSATYGYDAPQIFPNTGAGNCLVVRAPGWRISGLTFAVPTTSTACISMTLDQAAHTDNTSWPVGVQVDHCRFRGVVAAGVGITWAGAGHNYRILNNIFELFTDNCLEATNTGIKAVGGSLIQGNYFQDSTRYIGMGPRGFRDSFILGNYFGPGVSNTVAAALDNRGGSSLVSGNFFGGTYSQAGFYFAATGDTWTGNYHTGGVTTQDPQ